MNEGVYVVLALLVATTVAHTAFLLSPLRDSLRFWTAVEYAWLASAAVGLVSAGLELRRTHMQADLAAKEIAVRTAYSQARQTVHGGDILVWAVSRDAPPGPLQRIVAWYRYLGDALDLGPDSDRWSHFLAQNADLEFGPATAGQSRVPQFPPIGWERLDLAQDPPMYLEGAKIALATLRELANAQDIFHRAQEAAVEPDWEKPLKAAWPWLLSIALGLRLAKVHADYRRAARQHGPVQLTTHSSEPGEPPAPRDVSAPEPASVQHPAESLSATAQSQRREDSDASVQTLGATRDGTLEACSDDDEMGRSR